MIIFNLDNLNTSDYKKVKEILNKNGFYTRNKSYMAYIKAIYYKIFYNKSFRSVATQFNINHVSLYTFFQKISKTNCLIEILEELKKKNRINFLEDINFSDFDKLKIKEENIELISLRSLQNKNLEKIFFDWVLNLDLKKDGENGKEFKLWILKNIKNKIGETLFLLEKVKGEIIGTISVNEDDRGLSEQFNLNGLFIGGFNISKKYRLGKYLKEDNYSKKLLQKAFIFAKNNTEKIYITSSDKKFNYFIFKYGKIISNNVDLKGEDGQMLFKSTFLIEIKAEKITEKFLNGLKVYNLL